MRMQQVGMTGAIYVNPTSKPERVLLLAVFRPKVVQKRLDMLLHNLLEGPNGRVSQLENIERVMPAPCVRPPGRIPFIRH